MNTDTQKVLDILKDRGEKGIHSFHLNQLVGTTRAAARIQDLKDQGYSIYSKPERMGDSVGCRYFLSETPIISNPEEVPLTKHKFKFYMKNGKAYAHF